MLSRFNRALLQTGFSSANARPGKVFLSTLLLVGLSATVQAATVAQTGTDAQPGAQQAQVLASLQGYEWQVDRERLADLPEGSWILMRDLAEDETQPDYVRARAAASLTAFPNDEVWQFFLARTQAADSVVARRRSVDGLCATFETSRQGALTEALVPMLQDPDTHLRIQAATCLQLLDNDTGRAALSRYREGITQAWEARAVRIDRRQVDRR